MRILLWLICLFIGAGVLSAQSTPYAFEEPKSQFCTPVKNQQQTGTCWAFSAASFLESEIQRMGKGEHDLSEMYVVRHIYRQKCENYVRRQGTAQLDEGGLAHDLLNAVSRYGIVPENVYPGRKDPSKPLNHTELLKNLRQACNRYVDLGKKGQLPADWLGTIDSLLDQEFGPLPTKFAYDRGVYSPYSFRDFLGIRPADYVSITSFSHQPYHRQFVLEVPDNFSGGAFYNLYLEEMMQSLDFALQQGYTVEWDADVSNEGFSRSTGLAIVPALSWAAKTEEQRVATFQQRESEQTITPELRQRLFDQQTTQDDHLMHIIGTVQEKNGELFYVVKNSWGTMSERNGFVYVSKSYMMLNTLSFTIHKSALPYEVRRRIGLELPEDNTRDGSSLRTPEQQIQSSTKREGKPPAHMRSIPAESFKKEKGSRGN